MKAASFEIYGSPDVIKMTEVEKPKPRPHEVLIKTVATTVTSADARVRAMKIPSKLFVIPARLVFGIFKPRKKVLGTELSGVIEEVGSHVTTFKVGDQVIAGTGAEMGAHSEYVCVSEFSAICKMPQDLDFARAATISFGGITALHYLQNIGKLKTNDSILIYGASGNVGTFAIQIAKNMGATVTAVCSNRNKDLVISLGADHCITYDSSDFLSNAETYDIFFDTVGKTNFGQVKHLLKSKGKYLTTVMTANEVLQILLNPFRSKKALAGVAIENKKDLEYLVNLVANKKIKSVIDSTFTFSEISKAHHLVDSGKKRGSAVILF